MSGLHHPSHPVRVVTAAALFDGHDAAINIMRRILQAQGAEVIHLGHNRSVAEAVTAAIQEDVQAVAISSYQGGHLEYFRHLVESLRERGAADVAVFGGGGATIVAEEIEYLHGIGVSHIFSPADGHSLGLPGMVNEIVARGDHLLAPEPNLLDRLRAGETHALARTISLLEQGSLSPEDLLGLREHRSGAVLGVTGTGGSGKSSLTDELIRRLRADQPGKLRVAVLAVDPSRRRGGGALLGDRIRMNCLGDDSAGDAVFFRSIATRSARAGLPDSLPDAIAAARAAGYDLIVVETPGIGQGDSTVTDLVDVSLYVMTADYGASSQLEKIDMLDFADVVAVNKYERRGSEDARRDVARQLLRNREEFGRSWANMPVFGTSAASLRDDGVTALYQHLRDRLAEHGLPIEAGRLAPATVTASTGLSQPVPARRVRYLSEIADTVRGYHAHTALQSEVVRDIDALERARALVQPPITAEFEDALATARQRLDPSVGALLEDWPARAASYDIATDEGALSRRTLAGSRIPRVALPRYQDRGDRLDFLRRENLPGYFPFTAGVFPFKRTDEDPARMFAGEGDAFRTNRRFHLLADGQPATRLSTAFDSVTLYGRDPDERPDILGKVGTSGVSIATLDDMKALYAGFDLCAPSTSVSMTINGPAPTVLAFFLNTAIDQQTDAFTEREGRAPNDAEADVIRRRTLHQVRGTVQADILKEDQGQNTCIFSTEFSLKMMGDVAEWFVANDVRNFYSASISGYHIAEAGANPITQLAFTLANGFTYVESYLARGLAIDDFAPTLSFFFSNGMDAEYTVLGRVARRIWAIALRERYGAGERAQKLKYHVQTSGRSLHAQEMAFNDIRTTLQALNALYDNANSLHTNAYDEAVTTPSTESVRRALAIQLIINREWGLSANENPQQGSFIVDELTELVERAVLEAFDRLTERGGVLGAMETGYQRGRIQDESMLYEQRKHDGTLPIVGVNTFLDPDAGRHPAPSLELARGTDSERRSQLNRLAEFQQRNRCVSEPALARLRAAAESGENLFDVLMDAARVCSLGQLTELFFEIGGQYRRNV